MKRILSILLAGAMALGLAACGGPSTPDRTAPAEETQTTPATDPGDTPSADGRTLVVYFSATGNTREVAETLAELQGADLFEIVPAEPYTDEDLNYSDGNCRANREQNDDSARPAMASTLENLDQYDVVYLGFPIWWGTLPKILCTFLETYDLSGKTVAPFCTSGGSGIGSAEEAIAQLAPGANLTQGLRTDPDSGAADLTQWLQDIGLES